MRLSDFDDGELKLVADRIGADALAAWIAACPDRDDAEDVSRRLAAAAADPAPSGEAATEALGAVRDAVRDMERRGEVARRWRWLSKAAPDTVASYLRNEYPQTVAVVLSKLAPDYAGRVLERLPEHFAMEVTMRMLRMERVPAEVLDLVEEELMLDLSSQLPAPTDHHDTVAKMFGGMGAEAQNRMMSGLIERNRESAIRVASGMAAAAEGVAQADAPPAALPPAAGGARDDTGPSPLEDHAGHGRSGLLAVAAAAAATLAAGYGAASSYMNF